MEHSKKKLEKYGEMEIRRRTETNQSTAQRNHLRIFKRVLYFWVDLLSIIFQLKK